jgi:hypothetical protein
MPMAGSGNSGIPLTRGNPGRLMLSLKNLPMGNYLTAISNQDGTCIAFGDSIVLTDPPKPVIDFVSVEHPSDCGAHDGTIKILTSGGSENIQYSINGGFSWHASDWFTDLEAGTFFIVVRNLDGTCSSTPPEEITLTEPESPVILDIAYQPPGNCVAEDGFIKIFSDPGNYFLEYSIDNGQSWQYSSMFNNLGSGDYQILVRNENGHCFTAGDLIEFEASVIPETQEIFAVNPTDCGLHDGQIYILSEMADLQYSIDGGVSWQSDGFYQNLGAGVYPISVRSTEDGCSENIDTLMLTGPVQHLIETVEVSHPSDCNNDDGQITLIYGTGYRTNRTQYGRRTKLAE